MVFELQSQIKDIQAKNVEITDKFEKLSLSISEDKQTKSDSDLKGKIEAEINLLKEENEKLKTSNSALREENAKVSDSIIKFKAVNMHTQQEKLFQK